MGKRKKEEKRVAWDVRALLCVASCFSFKLGFLRLVLGPAIVTTLLLPPETKSSYLNNECSDDSQLVDRVCLHKIDLASLLLLLVERKSKRVLVFSRASGSDLVYPGKHLWEDSNRERETHETLGRV